MQKTREYLLKLIAYFYIAPRSNRKVKLQYKLKIFENSKIVLWPEKTDWE